jgi:hypothetical protein
VEGVYLKGNCHSFLQAGQGMGIDLEALFKTLGPMIGGAPIGDQEAGVFSAHDAVAGQFRLCRRLRLS